MAPSKSSDEVLKELRERARQRRRKPPTDKPKHSPSLAALTIRALKIYGTRDREFASSLARALGVYPPLAEAWVAGVTRPSPKRLRQIRKYLSEHRGDVSFT
jgi:hypothetical protein